MNYSPGRSRDTIERRRATPPAPPPAPPRRPDGPDALGAGHAKSAGGGKGLRFINVITGSYRQPQPRLYRFNVEHARDSARGSHTPQLSAIRLRADCVRNRKIA